MSSPEQEAGSALPSENDCERLVEETKYVVNTLITQRSVFSTNFLNIVSLLSLILVSTIMILASGVFQLYTAGILTGSAYNNVVYFTWITFLCLDFFFVFIYAMYYDIIKPLRRVKKVYKGVLSEYKQHVDKCIQQYCVDSSITLCSKIKYIKQVVDELLREK